MTSASGGMQTGDRTTTTTALTQAVGPGVGTAGMPGESITPLPVTSERCVGANVGIGVVTTAFPTKIEVCFEEGVKTLMHKKDS